MSDELNVAASDAANESLVTPAPEPERQEEQQTPAKNARDAIERAMRKVDTQPRDETSGQWIKTAEELKAQAAAKTPEPAPVAKESAPAAPAPADAAGALTEPPTPAPSRFSAEAKAEWAKLPPVVRAETERAFKELETGLQNYQQRWEPLKQFDQMAQQAGRNLSDVVAQYVQTEQALTQNPIAGFAELSKRLGIDPVQLGHALAGQQPTGGASPETAPLMAEIAELKRQLGGISKTFEQQQMEAELNRWSANKPRFAEVREVMGQLIAANMAQNLDEAYDKATRLQPPAPVIAPPATAPAVKPPATPPQTRRPLQITGSGSAPSYGGKTPGSAREAIQSAFQRVGGI